jgi:hypothetical protein
MNLTTLMDKARQIANSQGRLEKSPADIGANGELHLCSASCIARAAIEISGDNEHLEDFENVVASSNKLVYLPELFNKYGLDGEAAKRILLENDKLPEADRLTWFNSLRKADVC